MLPIHEGKEASCLFLIAFTHRDKIIAGVTGEQDLVLLNRIKHQAIRRDLIQPEIRDVNNFIAWRELLSFEDF